MQIIKFIQNIKERKQLGNQLYLKQKGRARGKRTGKNNKTQK